MWQNSHRMDINRHNKIIYIWCNTSTDILHKILYKYFIRLPFSWMSLRPLQPCLYEMTESTHRQSQNYCNFLVSDIKCNFLDTPLVWQAEKLHQQLTAPVFFLIQKARLLQLICCITRVDCSSNCYVCWPSRTQQIQFECIVFLLWVFGSGLKQQGSLLSLPSFTWSSR